jgi:cobalt-zinc-cadmium resistance protein CzcA
MLSRIIAASIHNKLFVALLVMALVVWGSYSAMHLPLDAIPDITNNQVQVITQSSSLAAQEVEQLITVPLELQLRTVPGVTEIRALDCRWLRLFFKMISTRTERASSLRRSSPPRKLASAPS